MKAKKISDIIDAINQVQKENIDVLDENDVKNLKSAKKKLQKVIGESGNLQLYESTKHQGILADALRLLKQVFTGTG
jgi:t-SNARE complex subunit (syntaxin)